MEAFLVYVLKASGILIIFYLVYQLFLKKETFFAANRHFLLAGLLAALILPLVSFTRYVEVPSRVVQNTIHSTENYAVLVEPETVNWIEIACIVYFVGLAIFVLRFALQLYSLKQIISEHQLRKEDGFIYVETTKKIAPFSFFNYIFYNPTIYKTAELEAILKHEKAHCSQWHSLDIMVAHLITAILWLNPLGWLYKKNIKQNLEFLADASAAKDISSIKNYQYTLLRVSGIPYCAPITNTFYNSLIKKRIVMLHKSKSHKRNLLKYILVLPMLLMFIIAFNVETKANPLPITEQYSFGSAPEMYPYETYIITKKTTDEEIDALKREIKSSGNELLVKKIKRNKDGLIISIKLVLKSEGSVVEGQYSNDEGIPAVRFGEDEEGRLFIKGGDHDTSKHTRHVIRVEADDDEEHDGDYNVIIKRSGDSDAHSNLWINSDDGDKQRIEIQEINGKKTIKVNGEEVSEEELKEIEKNSGIKHKRLKVKAKGSGSNDNVMIFMDSDDEDNDIEVISESGNGFFFIDTDGDEKPLFFIDGKEASEAEVKALSPNQIKSMNVYKDDKAMERYGDKAKDGVIEITTKKED